MKFIFDDEIYINEFESNGVRFLGYFMLQALYKNGIEHTKLIDLKGIMAIARAGHSARYTVIMKQLEKAGFITTMRVRGGIRISYAEKTIEIMNKLGVKQENKILSKYEYADALIKEIYNRIKIKLNITDGMIKGLYDIIEKRGISHLAEVYSHYYRKLLNTQKEYLLNPAIFFRSNIFIDMANKMELELQDEKDIVIKKAYEEMK